MTAARRRRSDAEIIFQGQTIGPEMFSAAWERCLEQWQYSRVRETVARGLRTKTMTVQLKPSWRRRHPEAAEWVVKVLPERRNLESHLIASVGSAEPYWQRMATGSSDRDDDNAEALENYMETWRKRAVPVQTFFEKSVEDGRYSVAVLPGDVDMGAAPDFYDRLDEDAWNELQDEEKRAEYAKDGDDPKGRYVKRDDRGKLRPNPKYDRDKSGKSRKKDAKGFERDPDKSREAHQEAVRRYLLRHGDEHPAVTIRVIPAGDGFPYLTRGTGRERWKTVAILERTLYYPDELIASGYGWRGMGDRLLIPQGFQDNRQSGQNGMFYLYTLYTTWTDPADLKRGRRIERPIIAYSVGGVPTYFGDAADAGDPKYAMPDNGVAIIDLYETHGLTGPRWRAGGGLHTSDDSHDFYWEPYLWPVAETILTIEGLQTMASAATAVNATPGYFHKPDPAILALQDVVDEDALVDSDTGLMRTPEIPDYGEITTAIGDIVPATPAMVSPDLWRRIELEMASLRANTALEQTEDGGDSSGRAMVVKETIAMQAKRQVREDVRDMSRFCGEKGLETFAAISKTHGVNWPLPTTEERPVGSSDRPLSEVLEFDPDWVGDGEYRLTARYPAEENPVRVEQALSRIAAGVGSLEELAEALGITDVETWWSKVLKTKMRMNPAYEEAQMTRLAKMRGDKIMQQVLALQKQQRMTQQGMPGFEAGMPTAALNGASTGQGGPTTAQRSLGGTMAAALGPPQQDARAQIAAGQGQMAGAA